MPAGGGGGGNIWTDANGTGLWSDPQDWSLHHVPTSLEDPTFDAIYTSDNCLWQGGVNPAGLNLDSNYGGTLKFNAAMEVGADGMNLAGGNISHWRPATL